MSRRTEATERPVDVGFWDRLLAALASYLTRETGMALSGAGGCMRMVDADGAAVDEPTSTLTDEQADGMH